jgi:hypothetical protein
MHPRRLAPQRSPASLGHVNHDSSRSRYVTLDPILVSQIFSRTVSNR